MLSNQLTSCVDDLEHDSIGALTALMEGGGACGGLLGCTEQYQQLYVKDSKAPARASPPISMFCQARCTAGISAWPKLQTGHAEQGTGHAEG